MNDAARAAARIARGPFDRRKAHIILLAMYWPALFVVAHIPIPRIVYMAHVSDKALHFTAYLILTGILWFAISPHEKVNWLGKKVWLALGIILVYGTADEILQGYVGRSCDFHDLLADMGGGVTGLILFSMLEYWPSVLAVAGVSIFAITNLAKTNIYNLMPIRAVLFNVLTYGFFAWVWIRNMGGFGIGVSRRVWAYWALIVPLGLLAVVEVAAIRLERFWGIAPVGAAVAGIAVVVGGLYWKRFVRGGHGVRSEGQRLGKGV